MDVLIWNATPAYRGNQPQPAQRTGLLTGLGSLIGRGGTPAYKTLDGRGAQASASSGLWPVLSATPVYKTGAPSVESRDPNAPLPDDGCGDPEPLCVCDDDATEVVIE